MSPLFIYLVKASATVFILWAFYSLCLRRLTFHRMNRYFFLTGILVSLLWPALPFTEWLSKAPQVNQVVVYIPVTAFVMQFKPETPVFGLDMAFKIAYFAGVLFMLVRLAIQIFSLHAIFKKSELRVINDVTIRVVNEKINPFSFFGYIFLNPSNHTPAELAAIILHEKVHETRTHSVDILLSEFLKILLWFNPFSWLFCRAIKENIEFEVDRVLLHQGIDCKQYQYSLLQLSVIKNQNPITTHFNLSNLKSRIIMMNKNQSSKYGLAAYALVIPLILVCMVLSYAFAQEKPAKVDASRKVIIIKQKVDDVPDKALIILDGKIIDKAKMDAVDPHDIYSVNVLKGKNATSIYGKKGKNGVVLITSKNEGSDNKSVITFRKYDSTGMKSYIKPLYVLDGVQMDDFDIKNLDPDRIESISVLKNNSATILYGDKGKQGVIIISTKKKNKRITSGDGNSISYTTSSSTSGDGKETTIVTTTNGADEGNSESTEIVTTSTDGKKQVTFKKRIAPVGMIGTVNKIVTRSNSSDGGNVDEAGGKGIVNYAPGAYFLLDGKEIEAAKLQSMNQDEIEKVEILKGKPATDLYGKKGEKGVIMVTSKKK